MKIKSKMVKEHKTTHKYKRGLLVSKGNGQTCCVTFKANISLSACVFETLVPSEYCCLSVCETQKAKYFSPLPQNEKETL